MEIRTLKPYFVVIALMVATSLALAFSVDVRVSEQAGVKAELPDQVGAWTGQDILFCLEQKCQRSMGLSEIKEDGQCPFCSGKLGTMSLIETQLLPSDTVVLKKRYQNRRGDVVFASLVLSGKERASIHRPEVCLQGQGTEITSGGILDVSLADQKHLGVKILKLLQPAPGPSPRTRASYFAYWFVGNNRETPHHIQRMIWMASDRILHNVSHRWAYISLAGDRDPQTEDFKQQIAEVVSDLYPQMRL